MTVPNRYLDTVLGAQALRRRIERLQTGLGGALGVRAELLPHQLQTVQRVLAAPRVRHLLADEVGLGKTVQTLMVINALRLSEPGLRVLLIVPNELMKQWRDEYLTRAHEAPLEEPPTDESERYVRLAWPHVLRQGEVDPALYDLLVVDELHDLPVELQRTIAERSAGFRHVLLLTATPRLQEPEDRERLLSILEPERAALAQLQRQDTLGMLQAREEVAAAKLDRREDTGWEELGGPPPPEAAEEAVALTHCLTRSVSRSRRKDYPDLLPARQRRPIVVEPTWAEVERQRLMWQYFSHLGKLSREFDLDRLAQRVLRSPQSLRQRVTYLQGHGHEREGLLEQVSGLLGPEHGDSRFDALLDLLAALWRESPHERILVVAQDNLTVDQLVKTVPQYLPRVGPGAGTPLVCAKVRNQSDAPEGLIPDSNELYEELRAFQEGEARVLFASDIGKVGLNLQCARILIFYSVPWRPEDVEQWIGRLDRIGSRTLPSASEPERPVDVYTIVQRGLVDERVVRVLDAFAVFRRGIRLDGTAIQELTERIRAAALAPGEVDWAQLEADAAALAQQEEGSQLRSGLSGKLPYTPEAARRLLRVVEALPPVEPVLLEHSGLSPERQREEALLDWLKLLEKAGEYEVRKESAQPCNAESEEEVTAESTAAVKLMVRTLWYQYGAAWRAGARSRVVLPTLGDPNLDKSSANRVAFLSRRSEAGRSPPRLVTLTRDGVTTQLDFLDHGAPLHEELISGWEHLTSNKPADSYMLKLPSGHPASVYSGSALFLYLGWADPGEHVLPPVDTRKLSRLWNFAIPSERPAVTEAERLLRRAHAADARWVRAQLPAQLILVLLQWRGNQWSLAPQPELWPWLLRPRVARDGPLVDCVPMAATMGGERISAAEQVAVEQAQQLLAGRWASARAGLARAVAVRRYVCGVDAQELLQLRAADEGLDAQTQTSVEDDTTLLGLTHYLGRARQEWLAAVPERAERPTLQRFASALCLPKLT